VLGSRFQDPPRILYRKNLSGERSCALPVKKISQTKNEATYQDVSNCTKQSKKLYYTNTDITYGGIRRDGN
jgi:hypothetical protein